MGKVTYKDLNTSEMNKINEKIDKNFKDKND
jgi:hypothetical protein